mgnify:CR=1 FL=1
MKVFGCKRNGGYSGGLILVAANTKEEAYLTAAMDEKKSYMFDWHDNDGFWSEPDGNIEHVSSDTYPLERWFEVEHLSTDLTEPQLIIEDGYSE